MSNSTQIAEELRTISSDNALIDTWIGICTSLKSDFNFRFRWSPSTSHKVNVFIVYTVKCWGFVVHRQYGVGPIYFRCYRCANCDSGIFRFWSLLSFNRSAHNYPRDAVLAPVLAMALCSVCLSLSVCLSVTTSQIGVLSKGMDGSS